MNLDARFDKLLAKLDDLDNQIQYCLKLMIIFDVLLIINLILTVACDV